MWFFGLRRSRRQWNSSKIKSHLKMAIGRIEIVKNKRTALLKQNMKNIAILLSEAAATPLQSAENEEKAYFRTQGIVRDDYYIVALEIIQLHCELLHERIGLIELHCSKTKNNDKCQHKASCLLSSDILALVCTIIWSTPYVVNDVPELSYVSRKLCKRFGKSFVQEYVTNNGHGCLNEQIVTKLSSTIPPPFLIRIYLEKICDLYDVDWKPSSTCTINDDSNNNHDNDDDYCPNNNNKMPPPPSNCNSNSFLSLYRSKRVAALEANSTINDSNIYGRTCRYGDRGIMPQAITGISTRSIIAEADVPDHTSIRKWQQKRESTDTASLQPSTHGSVVLHSPLLIAELPKSTAPIGSERSLTYRPSSSRVIHSY